MSPVRKAVLLGAAVLGIDWLTKFFAVKQSFPSLFYNSNTLLLGLVELPGFFDSALVAVFLSAFVWLYLKYWYSERTLNSFALIISGAMANLLDGLLDGKVVDFIDIGLSTLNFADFAIMGGIAILLTSNFKAQKSK